MWAYECTIYLQFTGPAVSGIYFGAITFFFVMIHKWVVLKCLHLRNEPMGSKAPCRARETLWSLSAFYVERCITQSLPCRWHLRIFTIFLRVWSCGCVWRRAPPAGRITYPQQDWKHLGIPFVTAVGGGGWGWSGSSGTRSPRSSLNRYAAPCQESQAQ